MDPKVTPQREALVQLTAVLTTTPLSARPPCPLSEAAKGLCQTSGDWRREIPLPICPHGYPVLSSFSTFLVVVP